ncbi:hypothetical protein J4466_00950 [Candidatus Pacearchaeota archaeon]|nr:hypothetical protein [Candidatus Pacearchaeota archaeon]
MVKNRLNKLKKSANILILIFGLLIIIRNYIYVNYLGYEAGLFYLTMSILGLIAIGYGLYSIIKKS